MANIKKFWPLCIYMIVILIQIVLDVRSTDGVIIGPGRCNREPPGFSKTPGNNGFKIQISGNPTKFVPGESYTISLQGIKTHASVQKFTVFTLVTEPSSKTRDIVVKDVGTFQLVDDALTKFSDECQNAIIQTSIVPKSAIHVFWKAPPTGSGCIQFKATLLETGNKWYMDDGELTKEICEEVQENPDTQSEVLDECCACDEAKYEVTFQGLWSRHTHPKDFPEDNWLTHFSEIIGASHSPDYTMWEYGGKASDGLKLVAETGYPRVIEAEMKEQSDSIRTIIKARGLNFPNLNGSTFAVFRVDNINHLVSLVTMLGPSPDWITGVSRLELCQKDDCSWVAQKTLNLYPWDAGTDSGVTYKSPDQPSEEREKIRRITSSYPNNPNSPFYDPSGEPMKPVARLTVTRQRLYEKTCGSPPILTTDDPTETTTADPRMECATSEWSVFDECSVTCGKGLHTRKRQYLMPSKAAMFNCNTPLEERDMCMGVVASCNNDKDKWLEDPIKCATTSWQDWGECSATCGKGFRQRTRKFIDRKAFKTCYTSTTQKEMCMGDVAVCEKPEIIDPQCMVTQWSDWSPCMVTCGKGMQIRTRLYLNAKSQSMCSLELMQKRQCMAEKVDCNFDLQEAMKVCNEPKDTGPCRGYFSRWYFDTTKRMCMQFAYGGCRGNRNNFPNFEDCNRVCEVMKVPIDSPIVAQQSLEAVHSLQNMKKGPVIDCMMSEWTGYSPCSATCGKSSKTRHRMVKVLPQNGGKACRGKLSQKKKCDVKPCRK